MPFSYAAAHQDELALLLAKKEYSSLTSAQKKMIDNGTTSSPGGAVGRAIQSIGAIAASLNIGAADEIPTEWGHWVILRAASHASHAFSVAEDEDLAQAERAAQIEAYQSFTLIDADADLSGSGVTLTVAAMRQYVLTRCVSGREILIPQISVIDTCLQNVLSDLWNMADWSFRQKEVSIALATNGTVTLTPSVTVDKVVSHTLFYTDDEQGECVLADRDLIQRFQSDNNLDTGKPEYFRTTRSGDTVSWVFNRTADQAYTMLGTVSISLSAQSDTSTMNTALALLPSEFITIVREWVYGSVLSALGSTRARAVMDAAQDRLDQNAYTYIATEDEKKQRSDYPMRRKTIGGPSWNDMGGFV